MTVIAVESSQSQLSGSANLAEFLDNNSKFVAEFDSAGLPGPPARKAAIVACMDARLDVWSSLGLDCGDCHVIRNAGGRVSDDALRSLAISQQFLETNEVFIIHHTKCGMVTFTNEHMHVHMKKTLGVNTQNINWMPFSDLEQSVIDDVDAVVKSPLMKPGVPVVGMVYDVDTGKMKVVATGETSMK